MEHCEYGGYCGSERPDWRECEQVCADCGNVDRCCADLGAA
jgi:hypothetical protein